MLEVEHDLQRPEEPRPTAWARSGSLWAGGPLRCAACGASQRVSADSRCGGVPFCDDCTSRSRDLTEWDDLGGGD